MKKRISKWKHIDTNANHTIDLKFPALTNRNIEDGFTQGSYVK